MKWPITSVHSLSGRSHTSQGTAEEPFGENINNSDDLVEDLDVTEAKRLYIARHGIRKSIRLVQCI
jgi:hypothetical protein